MNLEILPQWYWLTLVGLFGLVIGSFLNVVIYRVPAARSLNGRSHCPGCDNQIRWFDNIPVVSWLMLGGRCRNCKMRISARYPLVEAATAAAWVAVYLTFSPTYPYLVPLLLVSAAVSVALTMIDFDTMRLPDVIVYPTVVLVAGYLLAVAASTGQWEAMGRAGLASLAVCGFFFALWFGTGGRGLGFGDVKLALALGLLLGWFGWGAVLIGVFAAFVVGGVPGGILMATGVLKRGTPIPFGPMLLVGTWAGMVWGEQLWGWYLTFF
jgi:leader peptidase (prepilin peptidase) / N-methyltransferase